MEGPQMSSSDSVSTGWAARLRRRVDLQAQLRQHLARQIAAAPVEHQPRLLLAQRLVDPARGLLRLRPRQVLQLVVKLPAVRAGRGRIQQRPVVAEDLCIVEIEIVIARAVLTDGIVKRGVQMIALPAELDDVPGVQVALAIGAVPVADGSPSPSHSSLIVLAMPSHTPTPLVSGPMTSCEYGFSSLS